MDVDDLTLTSIDGHRHLATSEQIVKAVAFAIRAGHTSTTAYRFVTALVMTDSLSPRRGWAATLEKIMQLEKES